MNSVPMIGLRFGRLRVVGRAPNRGARRFWNTICDCGSAKVVNGAHMRSGAIVSCGCYLAEVLLSERHAEQCSAASKRPRKHGKSRTPVHAVWKAMIQRCTNPKAHDYKWYGALGVEVAERWRDFRNFYADMGEPNGLTLDRIDVAGNYEPGNCRWATWDTQRSNKRKHDARNHSAQ